MIMKKLLKLLGFVLLTKQDIEAINLLNRNYDRI